MTTNNHVCLPCRDGQKSLCNHEPKLSIASVSILVTETLKELTETLMALVSSVAAINHQEQRQFEEERVYSVSWLHSNRSPSCREDISRGQEQEAGDHIFNHKQKAVSLKLEVVQGFKPQSPPQGHTFSSKGPCPKSSITSPHSTIIWGPSDQIHKPVGSISSSKHHTYLISSVDLMFLYAFF